MHISKIEVKSEITRTDIEIKLSTLFPVLFLHPYMSLLILIHLLASTLFILGSIVPCDDFEYSSSNRVKPNDVFVNELFCGC